MKNKENILRKHGHLTVGFNKENFKREVEKYDKLSPEQKLLFIKDFRWALDYKIHLTAINNRKIRIKSRHKNAPMYFGNMGNENEDKHFKIADSVEGKIIAQSKQLKLIIEKNLAEFFFTHNFGTRQSKGYGSFTVEKIDNNKIEFNYLTKYSFQINTKKWEDALIQLGLFYQSLRSGINIGTPKYINDSGKNLKAIKRQYLQTNFYMKPLIFLYAKEKLKQQWDKKTIKDSYFNNDFYYRKATNNEKRNFNNGYFGLIETLGLPQQKSDFKDSDVLTFSTKKENNQLYYFDFRDLFGLSNDEQWYSYGANIKKDNQDVSRYKSPITFKPVIINGSFSVFIHLSHINGQYKGKIFNVKSIEYNNTKDSLKLQIPSTLEIENLFQFISEDFSIENHIDNTYKNYADGKGINYFETLQSIYNQLKKTS